MTSYGRVNMLRSGVGVCDEVSFDYNSNSIPCTDYKIVMCLISLGCYEEHTEIRMITLIDLILYLLSLCQPCS